MPSPDPLATQWRDVRQVLHAPPVTPLPWAQPPAEPPKPEPEPKADVPRLTGAELAMVTVVLCAAVGVGILGLASSFDTLEAAAARWHFSHPWMLPLGIDIAIPVFSLAHLLLIRLDMPLGWVRAVPWGLTLATVYLNWAAQPPGTPLSGRLGHAALPLVWVVLSEIAAHIYKVRIGATTGRRMEAIRRSRWLLAPISTARIRRRMSLWEITSYRDGLERERRRLLARAALRETYGWGWRWRAPIRERVLLRLGELAPADVQVSPEPGNAPDETRREDSHDNSHAGSREAAPVVTVERVETTTQAPGETSGESPAVESTPQLSRPALESSNTARRESPARRSRESTPKRARTLKTRKVSSISDADREVSRLVALMHERGDAEAVKLSDAERITGRSQATAARRLSAARAQYRRESLRRVETRS